MKSIFTRPLFINPQGYLTIPELSYIQMATPFDFTENSYSFKIDTSGRIEGKLLKAKDDYILHLDLYSIDGNYVLGEFYLNNSQIDLNSFNLLQNGNIVTINFSSIPSPIASYRCYDKTNDDADRNVLTDLTGNGHDIQLYNFAFAESSGYGSYVFDFSKFIFAQTQGTKNKSNFSFSGTDNSNDGYCRIYKGLRNLEVGTIIHLSLDINGIPEGVTFRILNESVEGKPTIHLHNGINNVDIEVGDYYTRSLYFITSDVRNIDNLNIIVEQIPDHQGALVSDGVDDYGLCENFPIFTKEKGYTIIALREILQQQDESNHVFISNAESAQQSLSGAFVNERINSDNTYTIYSFGSTTSTGITVNRSKSVNWQISSRYNGYPINVRNISATSKLNIFSMTKATFTISSALYALEIYDRDLTDEEIALVKARMIREYEEGTGNKYEEEETI